MSVQKSKQNFLSVGLFRSCGQRSAPNQTWLAGWQLARKGPTRHVEKRPIPHQSPSLPTRGQTPSPRESPPSPTADYPSSPPRPGRKPSSLTRFHRLRRRRGMTPGPCSASAVCTCGRSPRDDAVVGRGGTPFVFLPPPKKNHSQPFRKCRGDNPCRGLWLRHDWGILKKLNCSASGTWAGRRTGANCDIGGFSWHNRL